MPRTNKRKTTRASYSSEDISAAVKIVVDEGLKIRKVARDSGTDRTVTLTKQKSGPCATADDDNPSCLYCDGFYMDSVNEYHPYMDPMPGNLQEMVPSLG